MSVVDDYLNDLDETQKDGLNRIRDIVKKTVPEAEEAISYGMPAFKYKKRPLVYFAAFKDHLSLYPASGNILSEMDDKLAKYKTSKGTLQFTQNNPIPEDVIVEILHRRLAEMS